MIAIDLGSNTLRVLVYDGVTQQRLAHYEKVVKTADGLVDTGVIGRGAIERVVDAIVEAKSHIDFHGHRIKAVTTEALRRASNSQVVLDEVRERTSIAFEIISGEEEARLTLLAVQHRLQRLQKSSEHFVIVDIGGGSTEIILFFEGEVLSRSFPLGIVTIAQTYKSLEKIEEALFYDEVQEVVSFVEGVYSKWSKPDVFVATAGTPTTVAAMKLGMCYETYDAERINGTELAREELDIYLSELLSYSFEEREQRVGTGRSDLIAAGILIYQALYRVLGFERCVVVDDGLREGVALGYG